MEYNYPSVRRPTYLADPRDPMMQAFPVPAASPGPSGRVSIFHLVRSRIWLIAALTCIGGLIAGFYARMQTPMYRTHLAIEIQPSNDNLLNSRELDPSARQDNSSQTFLVTQTRVLQSHSLVERVVHNLALDPPTTVPQSKTARRELTPQEIIANLHVSGSESSRIMDVYYDSTDPVLASRIANALGDEYIKQDLEVRIESSRKTSAWLDSELNGLRDKLKQSETALQAYARKAHLLFAGDQMTRSDTRLQLLEGDLAKAAADRISKQATYENTTSGSEDLATQNDATFNAYQEKLAELSRQRAELLAVYKPEYFKVKRIDAQIKQLESTLQQHKSEAMSKVKGNYESEKRREQLLERAYGEQAEAVSSESLKRVDYALLKQDVETNRQIYEAMLQKVKGFHIASAMLTTNARVIDPAMVPVRPSKPNTPMDIALGLLSGFFAGLGIAVVGRRAGSIQDPGDSRYYLQAKELAVIPSTKTIVRNKSLAAPEERETHTMLTEAFRSARASLLAPMNGRISPHVTVISSINPTDGKTTVVTNLGISLAEVNRRVLLIDADLHRARLHLVFDVDNRFGFSDILGGSMDIRSLPAAMFAKPTGFPGVYVMPLGQSPRNTSRLFYSSRMKELLARARDEFDSVLVDTPPLMLMSDARVLGRLSDGLVLVLRAGKTTPESAMEIQQRLEDDGVRMLGTILNDWNPNSSQSGQYSYTKADNAYFHDR